MSTTARVRHETKSKRTRRQALLKAGVWIFLGVFALSVVGGIGLLAQSLVNR
ncbi:MAG: hypothetical protein ACYDA1_07350 [Vulcanimicrobiaceae bacterium]